MLLIASKTDIGLQFVLLSSLSFLNKGVTWPFFQFLGYLHCAIEALKIEQRGKHFTDADFLISRGVMWSYPLDLFTFISFKSCSM